MHRPFPSLPLWEVQRELAGNKDDKEFHTGMEVAWASQVAQIKESACQCRECKRLRFDPWVRKIP